MGDDDDEKRGQATAIDERGENVFRHATASRHVGSQRHSRARSEARKELATNSAPVAVGSTSRRKGDTRRVGRPWFVLLNRSRLEGDGPRRRGWFVTERSRAVRNCCEGNSGPPSHAGSIIQASEIDDLMSTLRRPSRQDRRPCSFKSSACSRQRSKGLLGNTVAAAEDPQSRRK